MKKVNFPKSPLHSSIVSVTEQIGDTCKCTIVKLTKRGRKLFSEGDETLLLSKYLRDASEINEVARGFLLYDTTLDYDAIEDLLENDIDHLAELVHEERCKLVWFKSTATPSEIMSASMGWDGFYSLSNAQYKVLHDSEK
jgi:hypothetical protein